MVNFAVTHLRDRPQQFLLEGFVVRDLILRCVNHHNTEATLGDILLELQPAVNRYQDIKLVLGDCKQCTVIQCVPFFLVNRSGLVFGEQALNPGIYALVNKDAHSTI